MAVLVAQPERRRLIARTQFRHGPSVRFGG